MKHPKEQSTRRKVYGLNVGLQILLAIVLLLLLNLWALESSRRVDLSEDKQHSISANTSAMLQSLEQEIQILVVTERDQSAAAALRLGVLQKAVRFCKEFELNSKSIKFLGSVDVIRQPARWLEWQKKYKLTGSNQVVIRCEAKQRTEVLLAEDMAKFILPSLLQPNVEARVEKEAVAASLAAAISRVSSSNRSKIMFSQGSGEFDLSDPAKFPFQILKILLDSRGYETGSIDFSKPTSIPEDVSCLVVTGAGQNYRGLTRDTRLSIQDYLSKGGSLLVLLPYGGNCGIEPILKDYGIESSPGYVADIGNPQGQVQGPTDFLQVPISNQEHPILQRLMGSSNMQLLHCRPLELQPPAMALVSSGPGSWLELGNKLKRDLSDPVGPFALAAASEKKNEGRLVVFSSILSAVNQNINRSSKDFLLQAVHWLSKETSLDPGDGHEPKLRFVELTKKSKSKYFWGLVVIWPASILLLAAIVFFRRRAGA